MEIEFWKQLDNELRKHPEYPLLFMGKMGDIFHLIREHFSKEDVLASIEEENYPIAASFEADPELITKINRGEE